MEGGSPSIFRDGCRAPPDTVVIRRAFDGKPLISLSASNLAAKLGGASSEYSDDGENGSLGFSTVRCSVFRLGRGRLCFGGDMIDDATEAKRLGVVDAGVSRPGLVTYDPMKDPASVDSDVIVRHILRDCISFIATVFEEETTCRVRVDLSDLTDSGVRECRISARRLCTTERWPKFCMDGLWERDDGVVCTYEDLTGDTGV